MAKCRAKAKILFHGQFKVIQGHMQSHPRLLKGIYVIPENSKTAFIIMIY